jgi:Transposase DDE domain
VDPDEELITNVAVTAANTADRDVIDQLLDQPATGAAAPDTEPGAGAPAADADTATDTDEPAAGIDKPAPDTGNDSRGRSESKDFEVYGDSAYADGATLEEQTRRGHDMRTKVPPVRNANGYSKDQFRIDLAAGTVTCPAHHTVTIGGGRRHRSARFGQLCQSCSLRADCTKAHGGRVISIHPNEAALQHAKARQKDPAWQQDYRRYRPVVERKIGHFTRRPWGGRKARCRGSARILTDILTRASVINSPAWLPWACTKARPAGPLPDPTPGHQHYQHRNHMLPSVAPLLTHRPHRQPPHTGHYISGVLGSPRARAYSAACSSPASPTWCSPTRSGASSTCIATSSGTSTFPNTSR